MLLAAHTACATAGTFLEKSTVGQTQTLFPKRDNSATPPKQTDPQATPAKRAFPWLATLVSLFAVLYPCAVFMGRVFLSSSFHGLGLTLMSSSLRVDEYIYQNAPLMLTLISGIGKQINSDDMNHWFLWLVGVGVAVAVAILIVWSLFFRNSGRKRPTPCSASKTSFRPSPGALAAASVFGTALIVGAAPILLAAAAGYGFVLPGAIAERAGRMHARELWRALEAPDAAEHYPVGTLTGIEGAAGSYLVVDCPGECILFDRTAKRFLSVRADQISRQIGAPKDIKLEALP